MVIQWNSHSAPHLIPTYPNWAHDCQAHPWICPNCWGSGLSAALTKNATITCPEQNTWTHWHSLLNGISITLNWSRSTECWTLLTRLANLEKQPGICFCRIWLQRSSTQFIPISYAAILLSLICDDLCPLVSSGANTDTTHPWNLHQMPMSCLCLCRWHPSVRGGSRLIRLCAPGSKCFAQQAWVLHCVATVGQVEFRHWVAPVGQVEFR